MAKDKDKEAYYWNKFVNEGDRDAYEYIYRKYAQALFFFGLRYTSDRELLKDYIQDVFVKLYQYRTGLLVSENIHNYLFTALKNMLLNTHRDKKIQIDVEESEIMFVSEPSIEDKFIEDETELLRKAKVDTILGALPERQREAMYYKYIEEKKIEDIAKIMNMSKQSVSNILQRAMQKIKKSFK